MGSATDDKQDKRRQTSPKTAAKDEVLIPCDLIVVAIGQGIETRYFEEHGVTVKRGTIEALDTSEIKERKGIFAGGDCVTGPATVIRLQQPERLRQQILMNILATITR